MRLRVRIIRQFVRHILFQAVFDREQSLISILITPACNTISILNCFEAFQLLFIRGKCVNIARSGWAEVSRKYCNGFVDVSINLSVTSLTQDLLIYDLDCENWAGGRVLIGFSVLKIQFDCSSSLDNEVFLHKWYLPGPCERQLIIRNLLTCVTLACFASEISENGLNDYRSQRTAYKLPKLNFLYVVVL